MWIGERERDWARVEKNVVETDLAESRAMLCVGLEVRSDLGWEEVSGR